MSIHFGLLPKEVSRKKQKKIKPLVLVRMLLRAGVINEDAGDTFGYFLCIGQAALDYELDASDLPAIESQVRTLHQLIDIEPCGEPDFRSPPPPTLKGVAGGFDDDDDCDAANSWKGGK
jgi:hypothetical protein